MILLDTCAIIWDALEPNKLTHKASKAINDAGNDLIICDISIWEISMLIKRNQLSVDDTPSEFMKLVFQSRNFRVQDISPQIAELSVNFGPEINNDPADRLISATSILLNAPLITADKNLRKATLIETIW
ncbi:MAG: type II toxin-antitoxin system VapC family toxin [gamma proteobacterium endosymbiont of Lamellibrachia anaximandri]|nr:type II toxin-antitoxin system VapC family toxin [gamma proteobacterium endosymbiont of Lamellibrachia anaximandri]MBL3534805.1 type II toxin-antitoxin system VapC family toxin [gamma proteobacterium endosymbiont of Lamellibrachia anaximandri]